MSDLNSMSLRELLTLRDTRVARYEKERKQLEDEQKRRESEMNRQREMQKRSQSKR